jgi:hypothetical protein
VTVASKVAVHGELINDAAEAICQGNYRASLIFSAMAVESCAGAVLDREYDDLLARTSESREHRCVTVQVNRSETLKKDPIFISLRSGSGEGGSRFLGLLHECPLYLIGKSLQRDNLKAYSDAHALYRTRNSLAHTGLIEAGKSGLLSVSMDGAILSLSTANVILNWFGEKGTHLPDGQFIDLDAMC